MSFTLSAEVNPPCVFLVQWSQLRGRLDAEYNRALLATRIESIYPSFKLRELAKSRTGGTPSKSNLSYWEGDIPWASPKDFGAFHLADTEDHISQAAVADSSTAVVPAGALLVVFRSGVLQHSLPVSVTTRETAINQDLKALIPSGDASAEYLGAYFVIFGKRLLPLITKSGATVQSINTAQFDELAIPVPSQRIQKEVVSKLVAAYARRADSETRARRLVESIDDMLLAELGISRKPEPPNTLESRIFRRDFSDITGERFDPHFHQLKFKALNAELMKHQHSTMRNLVRFSSEQWDQKTLFAEVFPYIEIGSVDLALGKLASPPMIPIAEAANRAKMLVRPGDLLISLTRPTRRAICFVPNYLPLGVASNGFCVVRGFKDADLDGRFLFHVLRSRLCTAQFDQRSSGGNYPAITEDQLSKVIVPLAKPKEQTRIAKLLDEQYAKAERLFADARADLENAKRDIEALILGKEAAV